MCKRAVSMAVLLLFVAATETHDGQLRFLQPKQQIVMRSPQQELVLYAQWYIPRHPDNRSYVASCRGACHWTAGPDSMEGEHHEAIMPRQPVKVAIDGYGIAEFTLSVFGPGGKLRESVTHEVKVCGNPDSEVPCG
jgi:hypothetical protein